MAENRDIHAKTRARPGNSRARAGSVLKSTLAAVLALFPAGCARRDDAPSAAAGNAAAIPLEAFVEREKRGRVPQLAAELKWSFQAGYARPLSAQEWDELLAGKPLTPKSVRDALDSAGHAAIDIERTVPTYRFEKNKAEILSAAEKWGAETPLVLADSVMRYVCSRMKYDALEAAQDPDLLEQYDSAKTAALTDFHLRKIGELLAGPLADDRSPSAEFFRAELAKPGVSPEALMSAVFARARAGSPDDKKEFSKFLRLLTAGRFGLSSYGHLAELSDLLSGGVGVCRHLSMAVRDVGNALAAEKFPGKLVFTYSSSAEHAYVVLFWRETDDGPTYKTYLDPTLLLRGKVYLFPDGSNPDGKEEFFLKNEKGPEGPGPKVKAS